MCMFNTSRLASGEKHLIGTASDKVRGLINIHLLQAENHVPYSNTYETFYIHNLFVNDELVEKPKAEDRTKENRRSVPCDAKLTLFCFVFLF